MSDQTPPQLAFELLRWFCPRELHEEIEGDIIQRFEQDSRNLGEKKHNEGYCGM